MACHWLKWLLACFVVISSGCQQLSIMRSQSPDKPDHEAEDDEFETKIETPLIGEYVNIGGTNNIVLQGVGLVTGLDGTGGDPPPSTFRTALVEDMKRRKVKNPNSLLRSRNTALVVVTAMLPPTIEKWDKRKAGIQNQRSRFDVQVRLPESSDATSLNGGWLMPMRLNEHKLVAGAGLMEGHEYAIASGPILISSGEGEAAELAGVLRRGRVLGGARSLKERDLTLFLRNDYRSIRNSKRISERIGERFHHYNDLGQRDQMAEAKTDQLIELRLHPRYKDNFARYLQVIRSIPLRESMVARRLRMQRLQDELMEPKTASIASIRLEALGEDSIPFLKRGLKSPHLESRFHSAVALSYLGDVSGVETLAEVAAKEPAFRVFAFAALSAIDDADSHLALRRLVHERSAETRYAAFRALSVLDHGDPVIRGENLDDQFRLHIIDSPTQPLIHLTRRQKPEVVIFGGVQAFEAPMAVRAGTRIQVTAKAGTDEVVVSRYEVGRPDQREVVSTRVADVIRKAVEFGASYPDIVQLLIQAERQHNLPGSIAIDALPQAGRYYQRPTDELASATRRTRIGNSNLAPNLFDGGDDSDEEREKPEPPSNNDVNTAAAEESAETGSAVKPVSHEQEMEDSKTRRSKPRQNFFKRVFRGQ